MPRETDPSDWMLSQAFGLIEQAERLHRQFFRLASSPRTQASWEPPADVFEDEQEIVIVVAMPGVAPERIEVTNEPGALLVRGVRPLPLAGACQAIRRLEIPYGVFERRIALPPGRLEASLPECANGCLVLRLRRLD
ncbi:MAG TPA: Hsp20/alpha crystallin family protein [Casimicrobiaceae bacterium]|nr:Hsp20/alpha crystallin family protein [Casimicrobiaceae bacterium]